MDILSSATYRSTNKAVLLWRFYSVFIRVHCGQKDSTGMSAVFFEYTWLTMSG